MARGAQVLRVGVNIMTLIGIVIVWPLLTRLVKMIWQLNKTPVTLIDNPHLTLIDFVKVFGRVYKSIVTLVIMRQVV